jgi:leucyl aminopeptidase
MTADIFTFAKPFLDKPRAISVPVIPLTVKTFEKWLKSQTAYAKRALEEASFAGKPQQNYILRDETGTIQAVLTGVHTPVKYYDFAHTAEHIRHGLDKKFLTECSFALSPEHLTPEDQRRAFIGWGWVCYRYTAFKKDEKGLPQMAFGKFKDKERVQAFVESIYMTRNLINAPSNHMGPEELENAARFVAKKFKATIKVTLDEDLIKANLPMIYAVGDGSYRRPRLIDLTWGDKKHPKVTIVGKGVCFDTGGLNIKPPQFMLMMKKDMAGAAHALGIAWLVMALKLPVRLRVLIPAVENSTSGKAFRPMDILNSRKGITVEIGDTDAEGRLVMADCSTLACEEKPDLLLHCATLTGAARAGLGYDIPAIFSNNEKTAWELKELSMEYEDPMWPLPLWVPYRKEMDSTVADINNVGSGKAGSIHGALFLREFITPETEWVHIDMYAWEQFGRPGRPKGGADTGLRALFALIENRYG